MTSPLPLDQRLRAITITPAPDTWPASIARSWHSPHPERVRFRAELGLPTDRPVIMSGHQAEFWHPGILAKYLATSAAAAALDAAPAWLVVDQDANAPADIRFISRAPNGSLSARTWQALPAASLLAERSVPLCTIPAAAPAALPAKGTPDESAAASLARIASSLAAHATAHSTASQVAQATADCLEGIAPPIPLVYATRVASTSLFASLLARMRTDPHACVRAYNAAVTAHPGAGMMPLDDGADPELPLWVLSGGGASANTQPRARATSKSLGVTPAGSLVPRALLMTALVRLAGCDLFIHGLGGGIYDAVTEQWIRDWLGATLAPSAVVTATLTLPLVADVVPPEEIDRASWRAHHARHDPALLGDADAAARKAALLDLIREDKRARRDPWAHFTELHALLDDVRTRHAVALEQLQRDAAAATARRAEAALAHDRTWAFPLYPREDLAALAHAIAARFAGIGR